MIQYKKYKKNLCLGVKNLLKKYKKEMVLNGKVDGLILTPTGSYYEPPLKWKPVELISIDFKIKKENNHFKLLFQNGKIIYCLQIKKTHLEIT